MIFKIMCSIVCLKCKINYYNLPLYLIILLRWLFAFSGFDFPTRLPVDFFFVAALALWAKGFFLLETTYFKKERRKEKDHPAYSHNL